MTEEEDVKNRWKEYIEELYCADEKPKLVDLRIEPEGAVDEDSKGLDLLGDEIRLAIKEMEKGKAVGVDGIPADFLKIFGCATTSPSMVCHCRIARTEVEKTWPNRARGEKIRFPSPNVWRN